MIILTYTQATFVKGLYNGKKLYPVEIKGNNFILPEAILLDSDFPLDFLVNMECREVDKSEFIEYDVE